MGTSDVIKTLSSIPIGTIIAWISVIVSIVAAIVVGTIKMYKAFEKTHEIKGENLEFRRMVKDHDEQLHLINDKLSCIQENLNKRDRAELKNMRYSIVRAGEEYISIGKITIRQLKVLEELFEDYHDKHGNGYVTTLMRKIRALPVIGRLDEDDNDIEDVE